MKSAAEKQPFPEQAFALRAGFFRHPSAGLIANGDDQFEAFEAKLLKGKLCCKEHC
jgi:hypothetical protein